MNQSSLIPAPIAALPWKVVFLLVAIAGFGGIVLYSAAAGSISPWAGSHALRFSIFMVMAVGLSRIPEAQWKAVAFPGYAVVLVLLIGVEALGAVAGGSQRWIDLGIIRLQPSELMKLFIVLAIARFYDLVPAGEIRGWNALWIPSLLIGIPAGLVMLQPDLGTALMIVAGGTVVMFLAGIPLRIFVASGAAVAVIAPLAFFFLLHDYQRRRVLIFLDPEADPLGAGYHISQSKIAIGSGGIFGKGFLNGSQSHLDYLPEGHTDFIFATMAEEWGLAGGLIVIGLYLALVRWGMNVSARAKTRFAKLTAAGLSATIFFYVAINLMMVMGLAPVVGIPLPMFSHGGTAMMTVLICIGVLMAIDRQYQRTRR